MKSRLSVTLLALSLAQCSVGCKKSSGNTNINASRSQYVNDNQAGWRTVTLKAQGISLNIPVGWHKDDESIEADHVSFGWRGPDNTRFAVSVLMYKPEDKPEYGNRSIEDETNSLLRDHKGDEDLRFLEIDGVRGVHFRRDAKDWIDWEALKNGRYQRELEKFIKWLGQRTINGKRQGISVDLSCPARSFARDQDTLYGILQSIKLTQNDNQTLASGITPAETTNDSPVSVSVLSEDQIYVRKQRVERTQVATQVDNLLWNLPEEKRIVYIKAMPDLSYGVVVSIIDDLRAIGYDQFGLVAANKPQGKPATTSVSPRTTGRDKKETGEGSRPRATGTEDLLVVTVETETGGQITARVGEARVPLRELESKVRALLKDHANRTVKIEAPVTIHYGSIVAVIDALKAGGAEAIALGDDVKSP
jgi:biopolymer transport protein ExbD